MTCNRSTGELSLSAQPIAFEVTPAPAEIRSPTWVTEELKLMGWKPLTSLDFFGDRLLPSEYSQAIESFNPADAKQARILLYRRWHIEKSLPNPSLVLGLLFDRAGKREDALRWINEAAVRGANEPETLADVASWELSVDRIESSQGHAEAALKLWPDHPGANEVMQRLKLVAEGQD